MYKYLLKNFYFQAHSTRLFYAKIRFNVLPFAVLNNYKCYAVNIIITAHGYSLINKWSPEKKKKKHNRKKPFIPDNYLRLHIHHENYSPSSQYLSRYTYVFNLRGMSGHCQSDWIFIENLLTARLLPANKVFHSVK